MSTKLHPVNGTEHLEGGEADTQPPREAAPALEVVELCAGYTQTNVVHGVSLSMARGEVVAVLGPNGAGKTTMLRAISGILPARSGTIRLNGDDITALSTEMRTRRGMCDIPEGRGIFGSLTVRENIRLFADAGRSEAVALVADEFPKLRPLLSRTAGTLSGGEQQMLALTRAYLNKPTAILIDEVSLGLAPVILDDVFDILGRLRERDVAVLLVEQFVHRAFGLADKVLVLNRGELTFSGTVAEASNLDMRDHYFSASRDGSD